VVTTGGYTPKSPWAETLKGTVASSGAGPVIVPFDYGLGTGYGNSVTATGSPFSDPVPATVTADVIGLSCATTFHYRIRATSSAGTTVGNDATLTTGACTGPFPVDACAAARFGGNLGCTANDVNLTNIGVAPGSQSSCISGTPVTLDLNMTVNFGQPSRYDIGIFVANDGKLPTLLPTSGGASTCKVAVLPTTAPFLDIDGVPNGTADKCGDGDGSIGGGTGSGTYTMKNVTIPCYTSPTSGGKLYVPFVVSWDNQASPIGSLCTTNRDPVPNTTSKCNAPASSVSINVVVLPKINKTHSGATFKSGDSITYSIVVFNDSGGTLQPSTLTDPAVPGLAVSGVTCAVANTLIRGLS